MRLAPRIRPSSSRFFERSFNLLCSFRQSGFFSSSSAAFASEPGSASEGAGDRFGSEGFEEGSVVAVEVLLFFDDCESMLSLEFSLDLPEPRLDRRMFLRELCRELVLDLEVGLEIRTHEFFLPMFPSSVLQ